MRSRGRGICFLRIHTWRGPARELDTVLNGRLPTVDDVPRLVYTRAVLAESMRLFPPAYLVGRRALVGTEVAGTSYVLAGETVVFLSQYLLHRDARFWEAPERFEPERWTRPGQASPCLTVTRISRSGPGRELHR